MKSLAGEPLETYNDVFTLKQNEVLPTRMLIIGEPGVGKSTLLTKYAFDWSVQKENSPLNGVKLYIYQVRTYVYSFQSINNKNNSKIQFGKHQ